MEDIGGEYQGYSGPKVQSFLFSAPLFSQTNGAGKRTNGEEKRTNGAEKRTNGAEKRTNGAEKRTNGAEKRTNGAEKRKCTLGPPYRGTLMFQDRICSIWISFHCIPPSPAPLFTSRYHFKLWDCVRL